MIDAAGSLSAVGLRHERRARISGVAFAARNLCVENGSTM
jgi:hypothetical protein